MKAHAPVVLAVLVALLGTPELANASGRVPRQLAVSDHFIRRGESVDVEMRSGAHVLGIVDKVTHDGVYVHPQPGQVLFVAYRDLVAIRDPGSGAIIAVPLSVPTAGAHRSRDKSWLKPAIAGGIVASIWILVSIAPSG